ncbi:MAG: hypothetical protein ABEK50_14725 [bacterium]
MLRIEFTTETDKHHQADSIEDAVESMRSMQFAESDSLQHYKEQIQDRCRKWDGSEIHIDDNRAFLFDLVEAGVITDFHMYYIENDN